MWNVAGGRGRNASGDRPACRFVTMAPSLASDTNAPNISTLDIVGNVPAGAARDPLVPELVSDTAHNGQRWGALAVSDYESRAHDSALPARCLQAPRVVADHVVGQILRNDLTTIASEVGLVTARAVDRGGGRKPKRDLDRVTTLAQQIIHLLMKPLPVEGIPKPRHLACRRDHYPHNHPVRFGRRIAEHDEATGLAVLRRGELPLHLSERAVEYRAPPFGCPVELGARPRYLGFRPRCLVQKCLSLG